MTDYKDVNVNWKDGPRVYRVEAVALSGKTSPRSYFIKCNENMKDCIYNKPKQGGD